MSNDNKTLADAQPGGRVRLGDAPGPEIDMILADAYSAGAEGLQFEGIARRAAVRAAVAALSAQPSPGGQDALASELLAHAEGLERMAADDRETGLSIEQAIQDGEGYTPDEAMDVAAGLQHDAERGEETAALLRKAVAVLAARQPVASNQVVEKIEQLAVDTQPVGEPFGWWMQDDNGVGYFSRTMQPAALFAYTNTPGYSATPLHTAQPAQAVDLGQFRAQVAELLRSEFDLEIADPEDHRHDDGSGEADRIAGKIVALLDSQAVGNG